MAIKKKKTVKKKVITSERALKTIDAAITDLTEMVSLTAQAVIEKSTEKKRLLTSAKRLAKKRATLARKIKTAAGKFKKEATAANKKIVALLKKEHASLKKELLKLTARKSQSAKELAALKLSSKRASAYKKAISASDKVLNKPKKKRRVAKKKVAGSKTSSR